jgi:2-desacetyl-2-hydroxyethyl bacteriochlorophyllide A dehydrogenase
MQAAVWYGEPSLTIRQWEIPEIADDEVLVRVAYAGICGSDLHILNNGLPRSAVSPPRIIGHEFSGIVECVGRSVRSTKPGDRVSGSPVGACGACYYCKNAMEHLCENPFSVIRGPGQGCFAEFVALKDRQVSIIPDAVSLQYGALFEPVSVAVHAVDQANVQIGDCCFVIGAGPIGLLIVSVLRLRGCGKILVSEPNAERRAKASAVGADFVMDPMEQDMLQFVREHTQNRGADKCLEVVGAPHLIEQGFHSVRHGGTLLLVGWPPKESTVSIEPFMIYRYEIQIKGTQYAPYSLDKTANILHRLDLGQYISRIYPLEQISEAFEMQKKAQGLKILLDVNGE